ncbi:MAG: hypothetical protein JRD49_12715 [Deltaproteobacteria bacterium]|nr:hypothetical protein [Deltaproteobacteria bacterium]MBW2635842.1 hypothetical protein [Deltaproteobacteria bacterium]MBW2678411.1 hypothetical protein [Deltaproteobacteria bacterium]
MESDLKIHEIHAEIQSIKRSANQLEQLGDSLPAVTRNALRILASTKMLEINLSDIVEFSEMP